jgi:hypothetical protein
MKYYPPFFNLTICKYFDFLENAELMERTLPSEKFTRHLDVGLE